ncbi:Biogenesis of lysosome-related organelles complex-1 [Trypanosoma melophagium]|uniref:Biogenesis of lysosome-related organelles complex-1 n=1 Tax=Trypanosoma melophagium TaxID=715481 RepID=UPI003519E9F1|nr:Biogenesis of lysosome-related organelles complex-1 [Trypanosoma melophagium]
MSVERYSQEPQEVKGSDSFDVSTPGLDSLSLVSPTVTKDEAMEQLRHAQNAMQKYITVEMTAHAEEWKLLGRISELLQDRCQQVRGSTREAVQKMETTAEMMERLRIHFARVDEVEAQLAKFSDTVNKLDQYSKALADRFNCA